MLCAREIALRVWCRQRVEEATLYLTQGIAAGTIERDALGVARILRIRTTQKGEVPRLDCGAKRKKKELATSPPLPGQEPDDAVD